MISILKLAHGLGGAVVLLSKAIKNGFGKRDETTSAKFHIPINNSLDC